VIRRTVRYYIISMLIDYIKLFDRCVRTKMIVGPNTPNLADFSAKIQFFLPEPPATSVCMRLLRFYRSEVYALAFYDL
jgi:hypothetical protein